jgi:hypothetical protein
MADIDDGVAIEGAAGLPHNHRLRAEALVAKGKAEDPDGIISPELIADTKERLAREKAPAKTKPAAKAKSARKPKPKAPDDKVEPDTTENQEEA